MKNSRNSEFIRTVDSTFTIRNQIIEKHAPFFGSKQFLISEESSRNSEFDHEQEWDSMRKNLKNLDLKWSGLEGTVDETQRKIMELNYKLENLKNKEGN
jgi:predicted RNase H-like nuclease (RuvC/YqgF family)